MQYSLRSVTFSVMLLMSITIVSVAHSQEKSLVKTGFDVDTRLERHVTLDETGVSLERLLGRLSAADLELEVNSNCASQRLQIALHDRPLRTLLHSIAELMPGVWTLNPNGHGYRFSMTEKAVAQREEWWRIYRGQHEAALAAQRRYVMAKLEDKPKPINGHDLSPAQLGSIVNTATFYRSLPHDLKQAVADQMIDTGLYSTTMLGTDISMQEGAVPVQLSEVPEEARKAVRNASARYFALHPTADQEVGLNIANEGLYLSLHLHFPDGREIGGGLVFSTDIAPEAAPLLLMHGDLAAAVRKMGDKAPIDWKRLAAFQEGRVWPNERPPDTMAMHVGWLTGPPRLEECLDRLKMQSHLEFVSDYYDHSGTTLKESFFPQAPAVPLRLELNELAVQQDISWKTGEGGIYLFRNNRWYRDDALQAPTDRLAVWTVELPEQLPSNHWRSLPTELPVMKARMDLEAKIVTELSPYQIANGLLYAAVHTHPENAPAQTQFPFFGFASRILAERYTALFYASLNETDRLAVIEGRLPFSRLNAEQQRQAIFVKPALRAATKAKPVWLRLGDMPLLPMTMSIPGSESVRGVRLEIVAPPDQSIPHE